MMAVMAMMRRTAVGRTVVPAMMSVVTMMGMLIMLAMFTVAVMFARIATARMNVMRPMMAEAVMRGAMVSKVAMMARRPMMTRRTMAPVTVSAVAMSRMGVLRRTVMTEVPARRRRAVLAHERVAVRARAAVMTIEPGTMMAEMTCGRRPMRRARPLGLTIATVAVWLAITILAVIIFATRWGWSTTIVTRLAIRIGSAIPFRTTITRSCIARSAISVGTTISLAARLFRARGVQLDKLFLRNGTIFVSVGS